MQEALSLVVSINDVGIIASHSAHKKTRGLAHDESTELQRIRLVPFFPETLHLVVIVLHHFKPIQHLYVAPTVDPMPLVARDRGVGVRAAVAEVFAFAATCEARSYAYCPLAV